MTESGLESRGRATITKCVNRFRELPSLHEDLDRQPNQQAREGLLDLMTGIALATEAMAALGTGDDKASHEHLDRAKHYIDRSRAA
jgi:hypothetical protein